MGCLPMTLWSSIHDDSGWIVAEKRLIFWKMTFFLRLATLIVGKTVAEKGWKPLALVAVGVFLPINRTSHVSSSQGAGVVEVLVPVAILLAMSALFYVIAFWRFKFE